MEAPKKILIGLEIHITPSSQKKIFNWENTYRGNLSPNNQVGSWELGYLGVLPILNPEVIELGLKLAASLEMEINQTILFERKIYNYFDLPKGYQITQQKSPLATTGYLPVIKDRQIEKIPLKSLQLEEDTAKSIYSSEGIKLDFNRAGNPLIELVTEPVFQDLQTVLIFIKQLQNLLCFLEISEAKMEKGQMRIDLNFSLNWGKNYNTPRYEIKNLNSLNNLEKAVNYEINKHQLWFSQNQTPPPSQTLGFSESKQITVAQREKTDYFYLPEVNLPPIKLTNKEIQKIKKKIPKLPWNFWEEIKETDTKTADFLIENTFLLKIFNFLEEKILAREEKKNWIVFSHNFLSPKFREDEIEILIKKWDSYASLFQYWKEKKLDNREINNLVKEIKETSQNFSSLIKKYEKKAVIDFQLIEQELKKMWTADLEQKLITERKKVQNYLLGKIKKKFPDYPLKEVIPILFKFLKETK
ncbi:MAG: aspartyl/glutamyl-tRNA(Asn/Gln) amidotransferase subunit B [Mycoplasmataceae bacterium RC_NB112A]|nr:MAG: aspartyl/glutamyl-tRNA(Asn/Gln) amidotransferase subunit B [Mycoplasmataceae bacterium RC_NB112A]KLL02263.1 MAG: aspartyl/glutamyl-tRNA(Asn/Gln) amidotransferase subunit B [Mycoplasmataceae bacterium RC_NB112A]